MFHAAAAPKKYDHIDFKPPKSVAEAAERGLEYRQKASPSNRGGLTPAEASKQGIGSGVQRATNLKNRTNMSPEVIRQMCAFFSRHEKNKGISAENKGTPWKDKGHVAWLLWGGDPGRAWAEKVKRQMEAADEKEKEGKKAAYQPFCARCAANGIRLACSMDSRGAWLCQGCGWTLWPTMQQRVAGLTYTNHSEVIMSNYNSNHPAWKSQNVVTAASTSFEDYLISFVQKTVISSLELATMGKYGSRNLIVDDSSDGFVNLVSKRDGTLITLALDYQNGRGGIRVYVSRDDGGGGETLLNKLVSDPTGPKIAGLIVKALG